MYYGLSLWSPYAEDILNPPVYPGSPYPDRRAIDPDSLIAYPDPDPDPDSRTLYTVCLFAPNAGSYALFLLAIPEDWLSLIMNLGSSTTWLGWRLLNSVSTSTFCLYSG